jgi:uncharacterized protein (DUF362 family)
MKQGFRRSAKVGKYLVVGGGGTVASTNSGNLHVPFLNRPPQESRSEVAIVKCPVYGLAESSVKEAIHLLGGIGRFCKQGDVVIIKVNAGGAFPVEIADTTNPAIVSAVVKMCKEAGALVKIMERPGFNEKADKVYTVSGIKDAALAAGADELWDWETAEYIEVDVPDARSFAKVTLPKTLMEANGYIDIPKLNIIKAFHHLHKLTLVDAVQAMEGRVHQGPVCSPGFITASPDLVAVEAVCHEIVGYDPLESPGVQIAMKDGLGTAELTEIDILGTRIQDVRYPFARSNWRFVQPFMNVKEYFGGTCNSCIMAMTAVPPVVDPDKKYAVVGGTRAMVARPLTGIDEVYLVGECACRADHQFKGYMDKIREAKKIIKMPTCPGHASVDQWGSRKLGGVYDHFMLLSADMRSLASLPEGVRPGVLKAAYERRSGKAKELDKR